MRTMGPNVAGLQPIRTAVATTRVIQQLPNKPTFLQSQSGISGIARVSIGASHVSALSNNLPSQTASSLQQIREKKSSNSYSAAGDEDINDVAAMGGVNLAEESQRMQGTIVAGTQIRSCKDETFLQTGLLHKRVAKLCQENGLDEPSSDVIALVSHATQDRLKTLLEKLSVISEHRLDIVRQEGD
jgi:transcription initiation factor TFIID subunit 4